MNTSLFGIIEAEYMGNNQYWIYSDSDDGGADFNFTPLWDTGDSLERNLGNLLGAGVNYNILTGVPLDSLPFVNGGYTPYSLY